MGKLVPRRFAKNAKKTEKRKEESKHNLRKMEVDILDENDGHSITDSSDKSKEKRKPVPQPRGAKRGILPDQPCAMMFCGLSKSGKSTLMKDTLTDKKLLGGYFHTIVMFSPTADADSTITSELKLPKENIITKFDEKDVLEIIDGQRKLIKKEGYNRVAKTNRTLFIFDDCIAMQKFLKCKTIIDLTATVRHLLISVVFLIQSYRMVARPCRINLRGIAFFQANRNETDVLVEEECHPSLKNKEFRQLVHYATKEPYSYLFINKDKPFDERYFKKYEEVLEIGV